MTSANFTIKRRGDVPVRTARCNDIIRREPREIPRRLRGLLLAIDGRQPISTYLDRLDGFGNVEALLAELAALGLVEFRSARRRRRGVDSGLGGLDSRHSESAFGSDSSFGSDSRFDTGYDSNVGPDMVLGSHSNFGPDSLFPTRGSSAARARNRDAPSPTISTFDPTMPGGFDALVRAAGRGRSSFDIAAPQPLAPSSSLGSDPVSPATSAVLEPPRAGKVSEPPAHETDARRQVDSLFVLLETVRGERRELKARVLQLKKYRQAAESLRSQNRCLLIGVLVLACLCVLLAVLHLLRR